MFEKMQMHFVERFEMLSHDRAHPADLADRSDHEADRDIEQKSFCDIRCGKCFFLGKIIEHRHEQKQERRCRKKEESAARNTDRKIFRKEIHPLSEHRSKDHEDRPADALPFDMRKNKQMQQTEKDHLDCRGKKRRDRARREDQKERKREQYPILF